MKQIILEFETIDFWSRPVFKVQNKQVYIGSVETLFPDKKIAPNNAPQEIINYFKKNKNELVIFGSELDCDPLGTKIKSSIKIKFKKNK